MNKLKKLGKGLEDISYLFLSPEQEDVVDLEEPPMAEKKKITLKTVETATKNICLIGNCHDSRDAFLVINLSLALARLGMRIAVVDMDAKLPCLNFLLGKPDNNGGQADLQEIVRQGPFGVKLAGLNQVFLESMLVDSAARKRVMSAMEKMEEAVDLVLISVSQDSLFYMNPLLRKSIEEFLVFVSPDKNSMLNSYKVIKTIFSNNPVAKIGTIITDIEHMYEIDAVFNKMFSAVKKFLVKELYKYGFLFKLKQEINNNSNIASFYDADLTACISNIAQIIILRLNLEENVKSSGALFKNIFNEFGIN
jgi:MinD-like ATPase involved in chromosome partitioning or flagellar assembly